MTPAVIVKELKPVVLEEPEYETDSKVTKVYPIEFHVGGSTGNIGVNSLSKSNGKITLFFL